MVIAETVITNKRGLHARAATKLANLAKQFQCQVWVRCQGKQVDGKSVMALMLLAAGIGTPISVSAEGEDGDEAVAAMLALIDDKFEEGE